MSRPSANCLLCRLASLFLCAFLVCPMPLSAEETLPAYSFGVFPFLAPPTLEGTFAPIGAELAAALGRPVLYQSASTFEVFMDKLTQQEYDIAHIQPFDYVRIAIPAGYLHLAGRNQPLSTMFLVEAESPLQTAEDMRGKIIGFPPKVAAASYLGLATLLEAGLRPEQDLTIRYFTNHQSCLQQLLIGDIDVCASSPHVTRMFEAKSGRSLRVLLRSQVVPQTLFVVHSRVPEKEREILRQTLLQSRLAGVEPGLRDLFGSEANTGEPYFLMVEDKEYDIIRHYLHLIDDQRRP